MTWNLAGEFEKEDIVTLIENCAKTEMCLSEPNLVCRSVC